MIFTFTDLLTRSLTPSTAKSCPSCNYFNEQNAQEKPTIEMHGLVDDAIRNISDPDQVGIIRFCEERTSVDIHVSITY